MSFRLLLSKIDSIDEVTFISQPLCYKQACTTSLVEEMDFTWVFHPLFVLVKQKIGKMGIENPIGDDPFYNPVYKRLLHAYLQQICYIDYEPLVQRKFPTFFRTRDCNRYIEKFPRSPILITSFWFFET